MGKTYKADLEGYRRKKAERDVQAYIDSERMHEKKLAEGKVRFAEEPKEPEPAPIWEQPQEPEPDTETFTGDGADG